MFVAFRSCPKSQNHGKIIKAFAVPREFWCTLLGFQPTCDILSPLLPRGAAIHIDTRWTTLVSSRKLPTPRMLGAFAISTARSHVGEGHHQIFPDDRLHPPTLTLDHDHDQCINLDRAGWPHKAHKDLRQQVADGKLGSLQCSADFCGKRLRFGIERHHPGRDQIDPAMGRFLTPPVTRLNLPLLTFLFASGFRNKSRAAMETNRLHKTKNIVALKISPSYLFDTMRSCRKPEPCSIPKLPGSDPHWSMMFLLNKVGC